MDPTDKLFGAFILILIAVALIPNMFDGLYGLNETVVPAWLKTALTAVVGAGVLFLVWRSIKK